MLKKSEWIKMNQKNQELFEPAESFKVSRYTHIIDENGKCLIYNARSNILARVPIELGEALRKGDAIVIQKFMSHKELANKLLTNHFVVPSVHNEIADALKPLSSNRTLKNWLNLTIAPTLDCNFSCPYCFEPKNSSDFMSEDVANKLISFLDSKLDGRKSLSITWYGGEPTLAVDRIEMLTDKIKELSELRDIALYFEMITNGYNLDPDIRERLELCSISRYQITLDGPPEIHDARRYPKSGGKSFWKIIENIKALMGRFDIDIRCNLDRQNSDHAHRLIEILSREGLLDHCSLSFSHVDTITDASCYYQCHSLSMQDFAKLSHALHERYNDCLKPLYPPNPHTCSAIGPNSYVIDPLGRIYRCWTAIGDPKEAIGTLDKPNDIRLCDTLSHFNIETDEKCLECDFLPICLGSCPYKFLILNNSEDRCVRWKFILHDVLKAQSRIFDPFREKGAKESAIEASHGGDIKG